MLLCLCRRVCLRMSRRRLGSGRHRRTSHGAVGIPFGRVEVESEDLCKFVFGGRDGACAARGRQAFVSRQGAICFDPVLLHRGCVRRPRLLLLLLLLDAFVLRLALVFCAQGQDLLQTHALLALGLLLSKTRCLGLSSPGLRLLPACLQILNGASGGE